MKDVLYVPGLKKNLLSISTLDEKGFEVAFVDGEVLMWPKGKTIDDAVVIGFQEGGLYKLKGHQEQALVHNSVSSSELWHRRLSHINYRVPQVLSWMVTGLPDVQVEDDGVCQGCALGKNFKGIFTCSDSKSKGILDIVHSYVCKQIIVPSLGNCILCLIHRLLFSKDMDLFLESER